MDEEALGNSNDGLWARHVSIEQAKGALTALFGVSDGDAFALLLEQSQDRNIKLHRLADALLDTLRQPPRTPETPGTAMTRARQEMTAFAAMHQYAFYSQRRHGR